MRWILPSAIYLVLIGNAFSTRRFFYSMYQHTYWDAEIDCQSIGGTLAKIASAAENDVIIETTADWVQETNYWIGGSKTGVNDSWVWPDDSEVDFSVPPANSIDNGNIHLALQVNKDWIDKPSENIYKFVCEVDIGSSTADAGESVRNCWVSNSIVIPDTRIAIADLTLSCPRDAQFFPPAFPTQKTWTDARAECIALGANLALTTTDAEIDIYNKVRVSYGMPAADAWTGGIKPTTGPWAWPGPTDSLPSHDECIKSSAATLHATSCSNLHYFICERPISDHRQHKDVCFWKSTTPKTRVEAAASCAAAAGGQLVKIDNLLDALLFQDMIPGPTSFWIGGQVENGAITYSDGSNGPTWPMWGNHSGTDACLVSRGPFSRSKCDNQHPYICQQTINEQTFVRNTRTMSEDQLKYVCDADYSYKDQTTQRTYKCSNTDDDPISFNATVEPCYPKAIITQGVYETGYRNIPLPVFFDGDAETCHNLSPYWTFVTKTTFRVTRVGTGSFPVTILHTEDIQTVARATTHVMVANDGVHVGAYNYRAPYGYTKCTQRDGVSLVFDCDCDHDECSVFISFVLKGMHDVPDVDYSICEVIVPYA